MNIFTKLGIAGGLVALFVWGSKAAKHAMDNFNFEIAGYGKPSLSGGVVNLPIQIKFTNPTPIPITLDQLIADIYIDKNGQWVLGAKVNQPLQIKPGESLQWITPSVSLPNVFGGNFLNTLTAVTQFLASRKLKVRTDVSAVYKGIPIPSQTITQDMDLNEYIS